MHIKYILFDLGKVILDFNHHLISERLARISGLPENLVHFSVFKTPSEISFEKGGITPKRFFSGLKKALKLEVSYREFVPLWNDIFWPKPGMAGIVSKLRGKYPLGMLSNTNKLHFDYVKKKFPVISRFDDYFMSFELGLRKPDKNIYRKVLRETGLKPREILYFDDMPAFVETAKSMGFKAYVLKSAEQCWKIIAPVTGKQ